MTALFVTGATGFIGRHLLSVLRDARVDDVYGLTRRPPALPNLPQWNGRWRVVEGDLQDASSYAASIPPGATVIHLAGAAGKLQSGEFQRGNVDGTRVLARTAAERGATHFVFVSSIAATYPDLRHNAYGASKRDAERIVRETGVPFTILRPTIVLGGGSRVLASLARLASLPVPVMFGRGDVEVQPVHVADVADCVGRAALERWPNESVDVGGPEVLSLNTLMAVIREVRGGQARSPLLIPLEPVRRLLALVEPLLLPLLPVSAGQLAAFAFSSRATPSPRLAVIQPSFRSVRAMVAA